MNGVEGWIIGTAFLWIVTYICVNPVAGYLATHRLRKTQGLSYEREISPESIPERYFMFSGALIFTVLGFLVGILFSTYFIGLSWKKRHLPGVAALILASLAGSLFSAPEAYNLALLLLLGAVLVSIASAVAVILQPPHMLQWKGAVSVTRPSVQPLPPARPPQLARGKVTEPRPCPSCRNVNRLGDKFCRKCGILLPAVPTDVTIYCPRCGTALKKGAKFCHSCGQAAKGMTRRREEILTVEKAEKPGGHADVSDKIVGHIEIDGGMLFFTSKRVIVARTSGIPTAFLIGGALGVGIAKHRATRKYRKLSDVSAEAILAYSRKNYAIPYAEITKVEMNKPSVLLRGNTIISTTGKEHKFWMTKKREFMNQVDLLSSVLPDKICTRLSATEYLTWTRKRQRNSKRNMAET